MTQTRDALLFLLLAAVWGSAFMAINAGLASFPPVLFAALRYDIAGVLMLGYAAYAVDDPIPRTRQQWAAVAVGAVFLIAAYHVLLFVGQSGPVTSAAAAVLVSLSPVLTSVFARMFLPSERLTAAGAAGLLLGLVGVAVLSDLDPTNLLAGATVSKLLVFGAAAAFALGSVLSQRIDDGLPIETMEAWAMLGGAALMHVVSLGMGETLADITWTTRGVAALLYLSLAASALGFLVYFDLLDRLGAIEINLVSYVAPVFAAISGYLVLQEPLSTETALGFLFIFGGFVLLKRDAIREQLVGRSAGLS
ncbi:MULTISPECIES: DMT family transporter [Haloprofundus]|uniref:DMT family transporter n=1 Tax=Haloprofundus TaxID=1911573 RepID=UPI000E44E633|nr:MULTISPECIES: EamA family transporter [Haloprofundus]QCJ46353.1 EamA/RhaT family transporter [Haloprofundus sp. MHR1]